jgi:anaerobic selenocysteine-containing dehydrogenase
LPSACAAGCWLPQPLICCRRHGPVDPESLVHSRYVIVWAYNVVSTNLHLWPLVAEAQRRGAKVVVIDSVRLG